MAVEINSVLLKDSEAVAVADAAYTHATQNHRARLPHLTKVGMRNTLRAWIASKPWSFPKGTKLGSFEPTLGLTNTVAKAHWKGFQSRTDLHEHLVYESDSRCQRNRELEQEHAEAILTHETTRTTLNDLRRALGKYLWEHDSWGGAISHVVSTYSPFNLLPNMTGSYNGNRPANDVPGHLMTDVDRARRAPRGVSSSGTELAGRIGRVGGASPHPLVG
ncbi:hypothetical protein D7V80_39090 [Corallococcus sp. CA054B]|uniref:hypothetical protein n=1 Tax=Corallococcus sp. CA054B TaxID=2316734 RepID=UPI000EA143B7|nr:hypothetical protein [Corallococcus sp. CA054B]RKG57848.1 hypothetical protein D7V80_39090 [Corallococcus sp. CA054B]